MNVFMFEVRAFNTQHLITNYKFRLHQQLPEEFLIAIHFIYNLQHKIQIVKRHMWAKRLKFMDKNHQRQNVLFVKHVQIQGK